MKKTSFSGEIMKRSSVLSLFLAIVLVFALTACKPTVQEPSSSVSEPESSSQIIDPNWPVSVGGETIDAKPVAVASLSPALTELLFDMGYGTAVTAVSDYCNWPAQVQNLPKTGSAQQPDIKAIVTAAPDVVVTHTQLSEQDLIALQQANIPVVVLQRARLPENLLDLYVDIARLMEGEEDGPEAGKTFYNLQMGRVEALKARVDAAVRESGKTTSVSYLRLLDYTVATGDTFEGAMLEAVGFENAAKAYGNWTWPADLTDKYKPDYIFSDLSITMKMLEQNKNYKNLNATIHDLWGAYDFTAFERQGVRMFDILEDMVDLVYGQPTSTT